MRDSPSPNSSPAVNRHSAIRRTYRTARRRKGVSALLTLLLAGSSACQDPTRPEPLTELWKTSLPIPPEQYWLGRPAADAQRVIVEGGNLLFALDATNGQILWQHRVRIFPAPAPTVPLIDGGRVFLAEVDSTFALDVNTGATLWTFHPDSQGVVVPAVDAATIYIGQRGIPTVYALDKVSGALRWRVDLKRSYPFVAHVVGFAVRAGTLYATAREDETATGSLSGSLMVALDAATGQELWRYETTENRSAFVAEPLLLTDAVIVNDFLWGQVIALDPTTHAVRWRTRTHFARITTDGSWLYGGGNDGDAHAINAADGVVEWTVPLGSSASGVALCGGQMWEQNGNLHRVDPATGTETGRFGTTGLDTFVSDIGTADNRVFVAGGPYVRAFDCR